jgi:predicted lipase
MGYVQPNNIKLMNFGSPRLGHPDFANRFPSLVPYAYRVVHNRDHVPHAPTTADGYQHIKNEVNLREANIIIVIHAQAGGGGCKLVE